MPLNPKLEKYCDWFLEQPVGMVGSKLPDSIFDYGVARSIILHREPPYQVELYIVRAYSRLGGDPHRHPDVDAIEIGVTGQPGTKLIINGKTWFFDPGVRVPIGAKDWHIGDDLPAGASFYSIQHWLNGVTPTSVALNWEGTIQSLVGTEHFQQLRERGKWIKINRRHEAQSKAS